MATRRRPPPRGPGDSRDEDRDPWPDPLDLPRDASTDATADPLSGPGSPSPTPPRPDRDAGRGGLAIEVLVVGVVMAALVVRWWIVAGPREVTVDVVREWASTSTVFVLGPALLAWLLVRSGPRETTMGRVMAGTTVGLLLLSTLLGEGAICVLMAAPLVYAVAAGVAALARSTGGHLAVLVLLVLVPLADVGAGDPVEVVTTTRVVDLAPAEVADRVAAGPRLDAADRPWLLTLGYPVPDDPTATVVDGTTRWTWAQGAGASTFDVRPRADGWNFAVVTDTAMRRWYAWEDSALDLRPVRGTASTGMAGARTEVTLTLRFDPALGPDWYFGTIERAFMQAAGDHLLDGLGLVDVHATGEGAP